MQKGYYCQIMLLNILSQVICSEVLENLVTLGMFFVFDSISSTQRRTGMAGKMRGVRALSKNGRHGSLHLYF